MTGSTDIEVAPVMLDDVVLIKVASGAFGCALTLEEATRLMEALENAIRIGLQEESTLRHSC